MVEGNEDEVALSTGMSAGVLQAPSQWVWWGCVLKKQ